MPAPNQRTLLEAYRRRRRLNLEQLGAILGKSLSQVQRYCTPTDDPKHSHPPASVGVKMKAWSGGLVHLGNYDDLWNDDIDAEWDRAEAAANAEVAP